MKLVALSPLVFLSALVLRAAEPTSPPAATTDTASHVVLQPGQKLGEKATTHRFEKLRAGAIKTAEGWNVQDFASSFFNPHPEEITVAMKMVSDDPTFLFANGQVGTYTKTYKLRPMQGTTDNIYVGSLQFGKPEWPVAPLTNFTGSVEFTRYQEQVVQVVLQKGEEKKVTLQELFGWAADQMSSMEGCLLISPSRSDAQAKTFIELWVVPNSSGEPLHEFIS